MTVKATLEEEIRRQHFVCVFINRCLWYPIRHIAFCTTVQVNWNVHHTRFLGDPQLRDIVTKTDIFWPTGLVGCSSMSEITAEHFILS